MNIFESDYIECYNNDMDLTDNNNNDKYCISRVSLTNKTRCKLFKKNNTSFCKKHLTTNIIFGHYNDIDRTTFENLHNINEENYDESFMKYLKKNHLEYLIDINGAYMNNTKLKSYIKKDPMFMRLYSKKYYTKKDLVNFLTKYFKLKKNKKYYIKHIDKIIKCQSIVRGFLIRKMLGPCILDVTKSINSEDVDGTELWEEKDGKKIKSKEVKKEYQITLFSFIENKKYYTFSLRTMRKLMETTRKNPYTSIHFNQNIIKDYVKRMDFMKEKGYKIIPNCMKEEELKYLRTEEQELYRRVFESFHRINLLGYYTDEDWFLNLSTYQLKQFYFAMKEIWINYDVHFQERLKIAPDYIYVLHHRAHIINRRYGNSNKLELQKLLIDQIDRLTTGGISDDYKRIGCWIVLSGLKHVSREASRYIAY